MFPKNLLIIVFVLLHFFLGLWHTLVQQCNSWTTLYETKGSGRQSILICTKEQILHPANSCFCNFDKCVECSSFDNWQTIMINVMKLWYAELVSLWLDHRRELYIFVLNLLALVAFSRKSTNSLNMSLPIPICPDDKILWIQIKYNRE